MAPVNAGATGHGKRVGTHTLRHNFDRNIVASGVPLKQLQVRLGHESVATTEGYLRLSPDTVGRMMAKP